MKSNFLLAIALLLLLLAGCYIESPSDCKCEVTEAGVVVCNSACEGTKK